MREIFASEIEAEYKRTGAYPLELGATKISGELRLFCPANGSINCSQTIFDGPVSILADRNGNFVFDDAEFLGPVYLTVNPGIAVIQFFGRRTKFHKGLTVRSQSSAEFDLTGAKLAGAIDLFECVLGDFTMEQSSFSGEDPINRFLCEKCRFMGVTNFKKASLANPVFNGARFESEMFFDDAAFRYTNVPEKGNFTDVYFKGDARFSRVDFGPVASFVGAYFNGLAVFNFANVSNNVCAGNFSKAYFNGRVYFDYSKFRRLQLDEVECKDIASFKGIECDWLEINRSLMEEGADYTDAKVKGGSRDTFRQIKDEFLRLNNVVEAVHFYGMEMEAYERELSIRENPSEFLVLFLNRISNNHSRSWIRGVKFTIITAGLFYALYLYTLTTLPFQWGWKGWAAYGSAVNQTLKYFIRFFNVTHEITFMDAFGPNSGSYLLDAVARIFISYGIVQVVQAFRKYGKS